jgi:hypothetical protein
MNRQLVIGCRPPQRLANRSRATVSSVSIRVIRVLSILAIRVPSILAIRVLEPTAKTTDI